MGSQKEDEETVDASIELGWGTRSAPTHVAWLGLPVLIAFLLFYIDAHAPGGMAFGVPYLMLVVLAQMFGGGKAATVAAVLSSLLVLLAPMVAPIPARIDSTWMVLLGRLSVVSALGMMVLYLRQRDTARETLREQAGEIKSSTSQRSDQLRLVNAQLHREIAERRRAELRSGYLASIVESSANAIVGQSSDGVIVSWNLGATQVYGYDRADVIGKPSTCLVPAGHEDVLSTMLRRAASGEKLEEVESVRLRSDGTTFDVSATFSPIVDDKGTTIGVSMIEHDITRRMRAEGALQSLNAELEEKVRQRTEDLELAIGELESFSYSVSHDLRAPLRALQGFAGALAEDASERLLAPERDLLSRILRSAGRMDGIVEDLLALSSAGNKRVEKEVVNLGEIARSVIEDLRSSSPERQVEWAIGDGLLAWGDAGLLRLVVQNLLGNAFKYTANRPQARIAFEVEGRSAETVTYRVSDNGAGFDAEQASALFRPFSRLHSNEQFEGIGIGLATVERIVRRHDGLVSAEGHEGEGATFRFRLPVPKRASSGEDEDYFLAQAAAMAGDSGSEP